MQRMMADFRLRYRTATVFRLLMVALTVLALVLDDQPADPRLLFLGAIYLVATGVFRLLGPRLGGIWLVFLALFVDVGAVTALLAMVPASPVPLWVLYLFAAANAAPAGRIPTAMAAGLSIAGYVGAVWFTTGVLDAFVVWPISVLIAATVGFAILTTRWLAERRDKHAWQEIAASARALAVRGDPNDVATAIAERSRRLVRARGAGIWWCDAKGELSPGPWSGPSASQPLLPRAITSGSIQKLDRGPVSLSEFGDSTADLVGLVIAVRPNGARSALLVVYWSAPPRDLVERRERLRVFAPWAAEALGQAQDRARAEELLRRVKVLQQATGDLAATDDVKVIHETCIRAVRTGLGAAASLVERASGRVLAGDAEVTEALVRWTVDGGAVPVEVGAVASQSKAPVATKLGENLVLLTWRASPRLDELDATWVEQLAMVVRAALERCAVYQNLREAEHQLRASLEAAPAPVAVWDANGKLVMANVAYLALDLNAPPPRGVPPAGIHEEEVLSGDPPRTFVAMTSVVPDGQYVVSVLREITRERQALQAKDDLIALVGHELRSPLTTIRGYSQMMARQLDVVQQQVGQLNQLIGDFMDASRLEGGQLPLAREPVDVVGLIRATAEVFSGAYEGRVLRLRVPESVPFVEGDRARLGQVLDNLLSNAAKYSAPETEIKLVVEVVDSQIRIAVQDKGIGIAAEHMPRLFTRFYRVPGAAAGRVSGYGLGLSIVRDLVAAHGGRVWAESPGPGQGSTFWVSLPVWSPEKTGQLEALGAT